MKSKKQTLFIKTPRDKEQAVNAINSLPLESDIDETKHTWTITIQPGKEKRRQKQNNLAFLWYAEISSKTGYSKQEVRRLCKWSFGIPILEAVNSDFMKAWSNMSNRMSHEQELEAMDFIEVTRLLSISEFAVYLTDMEMYYRDKGVPLPHPDDLYHESLGRTRFREKESETS